MAMFDRSSFLLQTPSLCSSQPSLFPGHSCFLDMAEECCSTQLLDGDGVFNVSGLENFMEAVKLGECGLSYTMVSIMGPQSSGNGLLLTGLSCIDVVLHAIRISKWGLA